MREAPGSGRAAWFLVAVLPLFLAGAGPPAAPAAVPGDETGGARAAAPEARLAAILDQAFEEYLRLHPTFASAIGDRRYQTRLTLDLDPEHRRQVRELYERTLAELARLDRAALPARPATQLAAVERTFELELARLAFPEHLLPLLPGDGLPARFAQMGSGAGAHPFATVADYDAFLARVGDFERWVELAIGNLRQGAQARVVHPRLVVEGSIAELRQILSASFEAGPFSGPLARLPDSFPAAERERLAAAFRRSFEERVRPAYQRLHDALLADYLPASRKSLGMGELPDGGAWYRTLARFYTTLDVDPHALFEIGLAEAERIQGEMQALARRLGHRGSLAAFLQGQAEDPAAYFERPEQVLADYARVRGQVERELPRLFGKLPRTPFEVRPVEEFRLAAGDSYDAPAADGSRPGIFFVSLRGPRLPAKWTEVLFLHEGLPGHHLQIALAQEQADLPRFLRFGYSGAFIEGWGLYAEGLGKELGLYRDPLQEMSRLLFDLGRAGRLVGDVGLHAKGWSREEAEQFLRARGLDWAAREIPRYATIPAQALSYKVGERTILALRERAERALGRRRFDLKAFHDAVLEDGALPLSVLEAKIGAWIEEAAGGRPPSTRPPARSAGPG
jgi:uncharacterized protein (DUF885 family)